MHGGRPFIESTRDLRMRSGMRGGAEFIGAMGGAVSVYTLKVQALPNWEGRLHKPSINNDSHF
jgi:hypothetical protein